MKRYVLPLILILLFMVAACRRDSDQYKITVASGEEYVDQCPKTAKAGETVRLQVLFVTDADMHISINGDEKYGSFAKDEGYEFIMPEENVRINIWIVGNGLAEKEQENKNTKSLEVKVSGGRWPPTGSGESDKETTGKGSLRKDSPKSDKKTEATTEATTAKKKKSTSATTAVDPFDHDIEAYYEDNKDIYDSFDDAWDGFEDDEDAWDDY